MNFSRRLSRRIDSTLSRRIDDRGIILDGATPGRVDSSAIRVDSSEIRIDKAD